MFKRKTIIPLFCATIVNIKDPGEWLKYTEKQTRGDSSKAEMVMEIETPNWKRTLEIKADVEGKTQSLVFIEAPAKEKGIGTLRLENKMWNYFPKLKRTVIVSPSMLLSSWMGSDFTNDDVLKASSLFDDYNHQFGPDKNIGGENLRTIVGNVKSDAKVIWPKIMIYSSPKDCMPRYQEYYDKQDKLIRTLSLSDYKKIDGHYIPMTWTIGPADEPTKKTIIKYKSIDFDVKYPENHFSLKNLSK